MKHLSIDIETYSSVDLGKAGLYSYVQSPDFQILLFAWSLDGGPVEVADLASGEQIPEELRAFLFQEDTLKHAYNAAFEWYCLSRYYGLPQPEKWLPQWRCTMLHGLYCGYPSGLAATGKALGLPEEKQKLAAGKALIRYFCIPCKPTHANGGRVRNLPVHDPEKWRLFANYNRQDVITEMEIDRRLSGFPVPDEIQKQWVTDQIINTRGVAVDRELVEGALACAAEASHDLTKEAIQLTGLQNPNSVAQLSTWLEEETEASVSDLRKETVAQLLTGMQEGTARRVLEIRQELSKTSTKKYNALELATCQDGRFRGMLQFYGANRTGRWAGRLVQPQNLPRTYLEPLQLARELVKKRQSELLRVIYGSLPDTLSQLIRTAFVASPGNLLVDADFSAIEARVIAWLAGEEWVLEVFRTHGKIYEACAAQMFGVPIDRIAKGNPEYSLRQKGKVATLALGYQGGAGALINMGALRMGIPEEELPDIVKRWRSANKRIRDFWYASENAAILAVKTGKPAGTNGVLFAREYDPLNGLDFLTVLLPGGRKLFYARPFLTVGDRGSDCLHYYGMNQTSHKWEVVDTYGGKLVENITQAVARDCLAVKLEELEAARYPVVFHVHDEVILDLPKEMADRIQVCQIMSAPIPWAPELPLNADGWVDEFYKKD